MKVLVIDDDPDDRIFAVRELKKEFEKVEVFEVASERELDEILKNFDFDVVITD